MLKELKTNQGMDAHEAKSIKLALAKPQISVAENLCLSEVLKIFVFNILTKIKNDWSRSAEIQNAIEERRAETFVKYGNPRWPL